jgi:hypothetical protein
LRSQHEPLAGGHCGNRSAITLFPKSPSVLWSNPVSAIPLQGAVARPRRVFLPDRRALAEEKGASWEVMGEALRGYALAISGNASEAVQLITSTLSKMHSAGAGLGVSSALSHLAIAHADLGQFNDAWRYISEAMTSIETSKEKWREAEVNRVAGEVALKSLNQTKRKRRPILSAHSR